MIATNTKTMTTAMSSSPASSMQKPSKSILKPAVASNTTMLGHKRKRGDMDMSQSSTVTPASSSPSSSPHRKKRARVTFEMDLPDQQQSQSASDSQSETAGEKSTAVVREEVRRAIQRHQAGDSDAYDRVKEVFTADPKELEDDGSPVYDLPSPTSLKNHLIALFSNVSALDGTCSGLVHAVLNSEWVGRDENYVRLFVRFLGTLAAARGGYLSSVLKMLASGLRHVPPAVRKLPGYPTIRTSEVYSRIHFAIKYIIQLVPAGSGTLSPLLSSSFPNSTDTVKSHITYTRNLIKMVDYAPELRSDILALVTEKLVKIDVQLQVDLEDFEDELDDDIIEAISTPEDIALQDEDDSDSESVMSDEESTDPEMQRIKQFKETRQKIDYMIDMLFEYYAVPFTSGSIDDQENTLDLLLAHFRNIILPTYRSRHSQFLIFYFSQFSPVLIDRFATTCIQIIFSKSEPTILRQYAAAYLASFVARGARVSSEVVRDVFDLLGTHLHNLRAEYEPSCRGPDLRRYGPFYSTAQALLYIFCFRWRDLTTAALDEEDRSRLKELELDDVSFPPSIKELLTETIYSKLNPLKICAPHIVDTFADLTRNLGFMYVNSLIETNKRVRISSFRSLSAIAMESRFGHAEREIKADADMGPQLDAYFPFDPYKLERSKKWVELDYIEWDEPVLDNHRDDTSNSFVGDVEEEEEEDAEVDDETGTEEDDDGY